MVTVPLRRPQRVGLRTMYERSGGAHSAAVITRDAPTPIHWTMVSIAAATVLLNTTAG